MTPRSRNPELSARARDLWEEYQCQHDLSGLRGKVAGIEPESARVWTGDSAVAIADQKAAEGNYAPVYLVRIGYDHFVKK